MSCEKYFITKLLYINNKQSNRRNIISILIKTVLIRNQNYVIMVNNMAKT